MWGLEGCLLMDLYEETLHYCVRLLAIGEYKLQQKSSWKRPAQWRSSIRGPLERVGKNPRHRQTRLRYNTRYWQSKHWQRADPVYRRRTSNKVQFKPCGRLFQHKEDRHDQNCREDAHEKQNSPSAHPKHELRLARLNECADEGSDDVSPC